jgi:hypothetical protein
MPISSDSSSRQEADHGRVFKVYLRVRRQGPVDDRGQPGPRVVADDKTPVASARSYIDSSLELRARGRGRNTRGFSTAARPRETNGDASIPEVHTMLAAHDFTERDAGVALDGYGFSYTNFTQARLLSMSLRRELHQAPLAKADLAGAHLEELNFCRTDYYEANLWSSWTSPTRSPRRRNCKPSSRTSRCRSCRSRGRAPGRWVSSRHFMKFPGAAAHRVRESGAARRRPPRRAARCSLFGRRRRGA